MSSKKKRQKHSGKAHAYANQLANPRADYHSLLSRLKREPIALAEEVLRRAITTPRARAAIVGTPFPNAAASLFRNRPLDTTGSIQSELSWVFTVLRSFADSLREFLSLRDQFATALFLGATGRAREILSAILQSTGYSLWGIEASLLLADLEGGISDNRAEAARISSDSEAVGVKVLTYFLSRRVEAVASPANYDASVAEYFAAGDSANRDLADFLRLLRFRVAIHSFREYERQDLAGLIAEDARSPIPDRYLLAVRLLQCLQSRGTSTSALCPHFGEIGRLAAAVGDARLAASCILAGSNPGEFLGASDPHLFCVIDAYTRGDYQTVIASSLAALQANPTVFEYFELAARSAAQAPHLAPDNLMVSLPRLPGNLLQAMIDSLGERAHSSDSLLTVLKIAYTLDCLPIGSEIFAFYLRCRKPQHALDGTRLQIVSSPHLTPRVALQLDDPTGYLAELAARFPQSESISLFKATTTADTRVLEQSALPPLRRMKYEAVAQERSGNYDAALALFRSFERAARDFPPAQSEAREGIYRCSRRQGFLPECAGVVADAFVRGEHLLTVPEVRQLLGDIHAARDEAIGADLALPILYFMQYREGGRSRDLEELFAAYDEFLARNGFKLASKIDPSRFDPHRLTFFLRFVATTEVMDSSPEFASTADLEAERIAICELLRSLDSANEDSYAAEISALRKRDAIRKAMQTADRSKIFIDTVGIRKSLEEPLRDHYERLVKLQRLDPRQRELLPSSFDDHDSVIVVSDEASAVFKRIFDDLRAGFISSNEHGLDSYLSVRVRHGTLAGQLRSPFERTGLVTRRDSSSGAYEENSQWQAECNPWDWIALSAELNAFSADIDAIIDEVKRDWIQIHSDTCPSGYFRFDFDDTELLLLSVLAADAVDFESFVDTIFDTLWKRTEMNLQALRVDILGTLRSRLTHRLDSLRTRLEGMGAASARFADAILSCRTAIQNEVDAIADWFVITSDSGIQDYDPGLAVDTAVEIIRNTFSVAAPATSGTAANLVLRGATFPHLLDVLLILFENAVRHSRPHEVQWSVRLEHAGEDLVFVVENQLAETVDVAELGA